MTYPIFPKRQTLDRSKLNESAENNFKFGKMAEISLNGQKTLWAKEKLVVTSNFSFSHSVFKRLILQTRKNKSLFGKGLILCQTRTFFDFSEMRAFLKNKLNVALSKKA